MLDTKLEEALIHHRQGRLDEASRCYEAILLQAPQDFDALFYLAQARAAQNCVDEAFRLMHAAAKLRPDSAEAQYQLGCYLVALRRPHQAMTPLRAALRVAPGHVRALLALGTALRATGNGDEAIACFRRAVALEPEDPEAHRSLGRILTAYERPAEGLPHLERAVALSTGDAQNHAAIAAALRKLGRHDEAVASCRRALELDRGNADAFANLGAAELELGELEQAREHFQRAAALAPQSAPFACLLAGTVRLVKDDERLARLEAFARDGSLWKEERIDVHFALGKAYADAGAHEESFEHYVRANALQRTMVEYDESATLRAFEQTARVLGREFIAQRWNWGFSSSVPVFIVGMPRSGTTLIEQILASHPDVYAAGELPDFQRHAKEVLAANPRRGIDSGDMLAADAVRIAGIGQRYVDGIAALAPQAKRITDKMPANATYIGLIHLALPKARIIRTRRDPVDTCLSCFSIHFADGQPFTYDLAELGRYYRAYEQLLDHWHAVLPPGAVLDVRYEDVVEDLESQARRIVEFCGLPWNEACLRFYETKRPVKTASVIQVRQPIYSSSVGRSRPYAKQLKPLLDALGITE